jgi:hypothetical protein
MAKKNSTTVTRRAALLLCFGLVGIAGLSSKAD